MNETKKQTAYVQVKLNDGKRVILRNPKTKVLGVTEYLSGIEVNKEGNEISPKGCDERRHLIDKSQIKSLRQLKWNLKYATLEPKFVQVKGELAP